jgi:hypothetical protein
MAAMLCHGAINGTDHWHQDFTLDVSIDIQSLQNRLLKVCHVPATSTHLPRLLFIYFLLWPLTVLMKQTRQAVHAIKQMSMDVSNNNI